MSLQSYHRGEHMVAMRLVPSLQYLGSSSAFRPAFLSNGIRFLSICGSNTKSLENSHQFCYNQSQSRCEGLWNPKLPNHLSRLRNLGGRLLPLYESMLSRQVPLGGREEILLQLSRVAEKLVCRFGGADCLRR